MGSDRHRLGVSGINRLTSVESRLLGIVVLGEWMGMEGRVRLSDGWVPRGKLVGGRGRGRLVLGMECMTPFLMPKGCLGIYGNTGKGTAAND